MKSVLLAKYHDVTEFASKDKTRYAIQSVHYNRAHKLIEAVDGRIMVRVPVVESDDFPTVKGQCETETEPLDCIIPIPTIKKALANVPSSNIPILEHAKLDANGSITLTTTDLDTEQSITAKPIDATYPNLDAVMPKYDKAVSIAIDPHYLKKIADYAIKHASGKNGTPTVKLTVQDDLHPLVFSITVETVGEPIKVTGCVMPVRMS